ncbi:MAG: hydantoinase/oxoprolinase family protein [Gammaproteobacteria bacterium]|nr:hydantoinase/oxoprolinase family protein [Gammaproteobacteria bacterium]
MTDVIVVDAEGRFSIGKASTTPHDQSLGYLESLRDALAQWRSDFDADAPDALAGVRACVYAGTAMLNTLLTGTGRRVGVITRRGDEDIFLYQRTSQSWVGLSYPDTLHHAAHHYPPPLVPRRLVKGVSGRIDCFGREAIPLYEHEVRRAVEELLDAQVDAIAVCLMFSYLNPAHELRVAEIAHDVMRERGREVTIHLSQHLAPIAREHGRLNTVVLHAYAVEPCREQYHGIERALQTRGFRHPLQVVLAHGGLASIRYPRLHESAFSGPIGGLLGARYLAQELGVDNWLCADMGGTSFDVGLIMGGEPLVQREVAITRRIFNLPTLVMDTIAAGMGMYVTVDPVTRRIAIGPESAGADPGPVSYDRGNETPTVMDCALITGLLNPANYLGGKLELNVAKALRALDERCARVLDVDPYYLAEGVLRLISSTMREQLRTTLSMRGFSPADYRLLAYGGAGPLLMALYTEGLPFAGIATVPWAAGFSAFGAAAVDIVHRYQKSTTVTIPHGADDAWKTTMGAQINAIWQELRTQAHEDFAAEGLDAAAAAYSPLAYVRYGMQMEDLEIRSPVTSIGSTCDLDRLLEAFERHYERIYAGVAKHERAGFQILELGMEASLPKVKPKLLRRALGSATPAAAAIKGARQVYYDGRWQTATLYDMDALQPGNRLDGTAVIEAPATTFFVPAGRSVEMDELSVLWLR